MRYKTAWSVGAHPFLYLHPFFSYINRGKQKKFISFLTIVNDYNILL